MNPTTLAVTLLGFLAFLLIIEELGLGIRSWRKYKAIRFARRCEITQRHFAEARNLLMQSVVTGDMPVNSTIFKVFYFINTAFLRRPDEYPNLSAQIRNITTPKSNHGLEEKMGQEIGEVGDLGRKAILATVQAFDHIVIDYSFIWRSIYRLEKRSNPHVTPFRLIMMLRRYYHEAQKKDQYKAEIQETKHQLNRLAMAG